MSRRDLLERIAREVPPPGFSELLERRERKARWARVAAGALGLTLTALVLGGLYVGLRATQHTPSLVGATADDPNGPIAFTARESGGWHVATVSPDGTDRRVLTNGVRDYATSWSPDGTQIAYDTDNSGIWIMNADGTDRRQLTTGLDMFPRWSPDGSQIAFSRYGDAMYKADEYTSYTTMHLWAIDVDGTHERQVTHGEFADAAGSWSPDGTKVAFLRSGGHGSGIWVTDANGIGAHEVVPLEFQFDGTPAWSPDGTKILYVKPGMADAFDPRIWVVDADGTDPHMLLDSWAQDPAWSPDGSKIAYTSDGDIWVMNANATDSVRVTSDPEEEIQPSWGVAPTGADSQGA